MGSGENKLGGIVVEYQKTYMSARGQKGFGKESRPKEQAKKQLISESLKNTVKCANFLIENGKFEECIQAWEKYFHSAQSLTKEEIQRISNQIATLGNKSQYKDAVKLTCMLLGNNNKHATSLRNMAILLKRTGHKVEGLHFIDRYLEINTDCVHGLNTKGTLYTDLGKHKEAIKWYLKCLQIDESYPYANSNLANEYHICAAIDYSVIYGSKAFHAKPDDIQITLDYLTFLRRSCNFKLIDKINWWNVAKQANPDQLRNIFLQYLTLAEDLEDQYKLKEVAEKWGSFYDNTSKHELAIQASKTKSKESTIRIGFVSPDFRDHSVARFIWPLFERANQYNVKLFCFSCYNEEDSWREKFEKAAEAFIDISSYNPIEIEKTIKNLEIDVLFDISGFTKGSKISIFGRRMAPVQVAWLGYPGTTGLSNMDFVFVDKYLKPERDDLLKEQCLVTRGTSVCFNSMDPIEITPIIPEEERGFVTFGSLNNSYKFNENTVKRWSAVMKEVENSNFLFVRREFESHFLRENIIECFEINGIDRSRIHFLNKRKIGRNYLDCYNEIDICLDTFPVTGGTTTVDSLWMGVPVVTLEGANIHQRVGAAIIRHAKHPEWIARTSTEYIQIAVELSKDISLRKRLRKGLREEMLSTLLCNEQEFARNFFEAVESVRRGK